MQSEMGFPSRHQLKSYVASKSRLKLAARGPVSGWPSCKCLLPAGDLISSPAISFPPASERRYA